MATVTMTVVDNILKEVLEDRLRDQLESNTKSLKRIEKTSEGVTSEIGGKYVRFPVRVKRNHGIGARAEQGALPTAQTQGYDSGQVRMTYQYAAIELTGQTFELAESNTQAFVSALTQEINGIKEGVAKDMNRQIYGTSIGKLATTNAGGTTTTLVMSNAEAIYLEVGMVFDIYDSANALQDSTKTITNIAKDTPAAGSTTVTFTTAAGGATSSGDYIVRTGSRTYEITGLRDIISNTGTLFNIDPSTQPLWKAEVDSGGGALSEGRMITMNDNIQTNGGKVTVIFCSLGMRRAYFNLLQQQRQFVNTTKFEGGFSGLAFTTDEGEIPVVNDTDCPWSTMMFVNEKELKLYQSGDWSWMNRDGSMWQRVIGYDAYGATLYKYCQLGTHRRNTHGIMTGLTEG